MVVREEGCTIEESPGGQQNAAWGPVANHCWVRSEIYEGRARWPLFGCRWSLGRDIGMQVKIIAGTRYGMDKTAIAGMQRWDADNAISNEQEDDLLAALWGAGSR